MPLLPVMHFIGLSVRKQSRVGRVTSCAPFGRPRMPWRSWPNGAHGVTRPTILELVFGEQVFQIRLGEAAREALFAEHISNRLGFALLQFPNLFFDRSGRDQPVRIDCLGLTDAMRAVDGLSLDCRVPPRIIQD